MPLYSMTGFGQAEQNAPSGNYKVEIKSVNNRFLELQIRLPKPLNILDQRIRKELNDVISRGSLIVSLAWSNEEQQASISFDEKKTAAYVQVLRQIQRTFDLEGDITLNHLLGFSDIITNEAQSFDEEMLWRHIKPVLSAAVKSFIESRKVEGDFIVKDLKKMIKEIEKVTTMIEKRAPLRLKNYTGELRRKIEQVAGSVVDQSRIAQEIALMADKLDIAEECTRLRA
ncbi:MAG: hypothetical protein JW795_17515, partial [Chitinivibrionales bacterium]|nr:hypothetical protein [Chitinivibrionales bacterium]